MDENRLRTNALAYRYVIILSKKEYPWLVEGRAAAWSRPLFSPYKAPPIRFSIMLRATLAGWHCSGARAANNQCR